MFPSSCEFGLALSNVELKSEGDFKSYMVFCFMILHVIMLPLPPPRGPPHCPWHPSQSSDSPAMQHQVRAPSCRGLLLPRGFPLPPAPLVSVFQDRMLRALHYILCWNPLLMASPPSPLPAWEAIPPAKLCLHQMRTLLLTGSKALSKSAAGFSRPRPLQAGFLLLFLRRHPKCFP